MMRTKLPNSYADVMRWADGQLTQGRTVWCVRWKTRGLITSYVSLDAGETLAGLTEFEGEPVSEFNVQAVVRGPGGRPMHGPECEWPTP